MLIRNYRARNRAQREAAVYLSVVPLVYLFMYISCLNLGETWHVTSDLWMRWFVYTGNWRLPYFNSVNSQGYLGRNYNELGSFVSDHYP